jgi:hypothetical protein
VDLISASDDELSPEFTLQKATVFLQNLIEGKLGLYYYNPKFGAEQFFLRDLNTISPLLYKPYKLIQDGKESTLANKRYINQLKIAMEDCPSLQSSIQETSYKRGSLVKLFLDYHECISQPILYHKEKEKLKPKFMLSAGLSSTSVKFSSTYYLAEIDFENHNPRPAVAAGIQFILPKSQQRLSIPFEMMVTSFKLSGIYNDDLMPDTIDIGYTYLKWSLSLLYTLPVGKMKLFGGAGLANARSIHGINCRINNSVFQNLQKSKAINQEGSSERSILFRLGILVKNYSLDIRFENTNGFSQRDDLHVEEHRLYAMLGYRF